MYREFQCIRTQGFHLCDNLLGGLATFKQNNGAIKPIRPDPAAPWKMA